MLNIRKCALVSMFYELSTIIWEWKHAEKVNMVLDKILENILERIVLCRAEGGANDPLSFSIYSAFFFPIDFKSLSCSDNWKRRSHPPHPQVREREFVHSNGRKKREGKKKGRNRSLNLGVTSPQRTREHQTPKKKTRVILPSSGRINICHYSEY